MHRSNVRFGGGLEHTLLHPVALVAMLLTILLIFLLPRKYVIVPFLFCGVLIPLGQEIVVGGVHLMVLRLLVLAGVLRMLGAMLFSQKKLLPCGLGAMDRYFLLWVFFAALVPVLLFREAGAVIKSCAFVLDAAGSYLLFRFLILEKEDIYRVLKTLGWICVVVALGMCFEQLRRVNVFGYLGSFPAISGIRDGRIRSQGPFAGPITAGCFGATLFPLFYLLWKMGRAKTTAVFGLISSTLIMVTSASSTPLLAYAAGVCAICLWPLRRKMRMMRWGLVMVLVALQLVMKAPIWFVITHFEIVGGSSNYQRAELIQGFVTHFSNWWLLGTAGNGNFGWLMWDMTNQYVVEGYTGGLATLFCFIAVMVVGFKWLGKARKNVESDRKQEWFFWLFGAALFANVVAFFGISYFDQMRMVWFVVLALTATAALPVLKENPVRETVVGAPSRAPRLPYRSASTDRATGNGRKPLVSPR